jgi:hypothetical protein
MCAGTYPALQSPMHDVNHCFPQTAHCSSGERWPAYVFARLLDLATSGSNLATPLVPCPYVTSMTALPSKAVAAITLSGPVPSPNRSASCELSRRTQYSFHP